ncbi:hypothetical protein BT96DRAFT_963987 [Gymnopus androsaceus JB14]|uniref:UDP-Glycosyltransferase/glycogen phosphorylase n=1 Tax=Gymnopus androsaceus JB14 TaxID=1447944 RepID=A0A6A4I8Y7_9AGAR|nr:hypothetical protein BT96DRAFT_963987 [Gymnopus androsaceus JB14]
MRAPCYVYYCSGHGYGHATRVSFYLPVIFIVSSAPKQVFSDSVALGAQYRYADWVDPIIKSVEVLKAFLKNKDAFLKIEHEWLLSVQARCVLSDAAFLGCLAAKAAGVPSILVTNFTFDSVYSYLATNFIDEQHSVQPGGTPALAPDVPIPHSLLEPLVSQIHAGYRCADLLLLLPGHIPIPSFPTQLSLPATSWVDPQENRFSPEVIEHLLCLKEHPYECVLHDHVPFPPNTALSQRSFTRKVLPMPLLVRPPSSSVERSPYTPEGRARLLKSANVPPELHDPETTKLLIVSFGGQVLKWPGRKRATASTGERNAKPIPTAPINPGLKKTSRLFPLAIPQLTISPSIQPQQLSELEDHRDIDPQPPQSPRLATASHIWIPGAPAVLNPVGSPVISSSSPHDDELSFPQLLPDSNWIAIVCGASKEQREDTSELPENFYLAPKDPSADVLLGKLGYGTVAECIDAGTPMVYVSRPLFIEELGLRVLLENEGVGVEMSRGEYEDGHWSDRVKEAWEKARVAKKWKRKVEEGEKRDGAAGITEREAETRKMASVVVDWVEGCWKDI